MVTPLLEKPLGLGLHRGGFTLVWALSPRMKQGLCREYLSYSEDRVDGLEVLAVCSITF